MPRTGEQGVRLRILSERAWPELRGRGAQTIIANGGCGNVSVAG